MYDRLAEVKRQHENAYKQNPHGTTLHKRDIDWLINSVGKLRIDNEFLQRENELLKNKITEMCPHKHFEYGLYASIPPKKRCLDCGAFITV